jgi:hypothetical protein
MAGDEYPEYPIPTDYQSLVLLLMKPPFSPSLEVLRFLTENVQKQNRVCRQDPDAVRDKAKRCEAKSRKVRQKHQREPGQEENECTRRNGKGMPRYCRTCRLRWLIGGASMPLPARQRRGGVKFGGGHVGEQAQMAKEQAGLDGFLHRRHDDEYDQEVDDGNEKMESAMEV